MTSTALLLKRSIKSGASVANAVVGFPRMAPGSVNIIAYHRVVADIAKAERDAIYGIVISTQTFRRHCELLRQAFDVVSLKTAVHFLGNKRKVARPMAVITFDDGYRDFYEEAFPVLNDLGLPATVFLPTDCVGENRPLAHDRIFWLLKLAFEKSIPIAGALRKAGLADDVTDRFCRSVDLLKLTDSIVYLKNDLRERVIDQLERELGDKFEDYPQEYQLLDWEMVREMARKGIHFGGHTANHVILPLEDEGVVKTEISSSKTQLEDRLGERVVSFAYPNGEYNAEIKSLTAQTGYEVAVTTKNRINRPGTDLLELGRTSLCEESTRGLSGAYSPAVANLRFGV